MKKSLIKQDWLELQAVCDSVKMKYTGLHYPLNLRRIILDYGIENAWVNKDNYLLDAHSQSHKHDHLFDKLPETIINQDGFASLCSTLPVKSAAHYLAYLKKEGADIQSIVNEQTLHHPEVMGNILIELLNKKMIDFDKTLPAFIAFTDSLKKRSLPEVVYLAEEELELYQKTLLYVMPLYDKLGAQFCDNLYAGFVTKFPTLTRAQLTKQEAITEFFKNKDMSYLYESYPTLEAHFQPKQIINSWETNVYVYEVDVNMFAFEHAVATNKITSSYGTITNFFHNFDAIKDQLVFSYYKQNPSSDGRDMHIFCFAVKPTCNYDVFKHNMELFMDAMHDVIKGKQRLERDYMENMWNTLTLYQDLSDNLETQAVKIKRPKV